MNKNTNRIISLRSYQIAKQLQGSGLEKSLGQQKLDAVILLAASLVSEQRWFIFQGIPTHNF